MIKVLLNFCFLGAMLSCGKGFDKEPTVPYESRQQDNYEQELTSKEGFLALANQHRAKLGLRSLEWNNILEDQAEGHSLGMGLRTRTFGHSAFNIRCRRIRNRLGLSKLSACGEIVARGQQDHEAVFKTWMDASQHRKSLENPVFTHIGLGVFRSKGGVLYWTLMFIEY